MEEPRKDAWGLETGVVFPDSSKPWIGRDYFLLCCLEPKFKTFSTVHLAFILLVPCFCYMLLACTVF